MRSVHLHIDRIVVEGLPETGQRQFSRALEDRLRAWAGSGIADGFASDAWMRIRVLDAGQLRTGATASQAAAQVVRSVARSVTRSVARPIEKSVGAGSRSPRIASGGEARGHV